MEYYIRQKTSAPLAMTAAKGKKQRNTLAVIPGVAQGGIKELNFWFQNAAWRFPLRFMSGQRSLSFRSGGRSRGDSQESSKFITPFFHKLKPLYNLQSSSANNLLMRISNQKGNSLYEPSPYSRPRAN